MSDTQGQIMAALARRPMQFYEIHDSCGDVYFRVVDRELQKLRKAGRIAYNRAKCQWSALSGDTYPGRTDGMSDHV